VRGGDQAAVFSRKPSITGRKIRFALVGCGRISPKHFEAIEAHAKAAELVAVADIDPAALERAVAATGAKGFASLEALLAGSDPDLVILATPSGLHAPQATLVAEAGRHVMTEKPMATRWQDGKAMVQACDEAGIHLFVVKQNRRNPTLQLLRRAIEADRRDPVLRVYGWSRPTLSIGAKTDLPEAVHARCAASGVEVVRRATGGGCVLHDGDVTYSVIAPEAGRSVLAAYRWVAQGLIAGLGLLGLEAAVAEHQTLGRPLDCFRAATGADLQVGGRKVCGSAQVRRQGWFLQHGSIPVPDIRAKTASLLGGEVDDSSTCLEESLGRRRPGSSADEVERALVAGFARAWGREPGRRRPQAREWALAEEIEEGARGGVAAQPGAR